MKPNHQPGEYLSLRWDGDPDEVYLYGHVDLPGRDVVHYITDGRERTEPHIVATAFDLYGVSE